MRGGTLAVAGMLLYNLSSAAVPLLAIHKDSDQAAATIFFWCLAISMAAFFTGIGFSLSFYFLRQKWPASCCLVLSMTPFLACLVGQQFVIWMRRS